MIRPPFMSITDMISVHARNRPTSIAWQTDAKVVDWHAFNAAVSRSASDLVRMGIAKSQTVAFLADSSLWTWTHLFGTLRACGTVAPLNTLQRADTLVAMLRDSQAAFLIVSSAFTDLANEVVASFGPNETRPVVVSEDDPLTDPYTLSDTQPDVGPTVTLSPDDPCNIIYSSGTTGVPKGIVHTHGARVATGSLFALMYHVSADARLLLTTPPHTNGSWIMVLPMIHVGGTTILSPGFSPEDFILRVREYRPTLALLVPTMAQRLVEHPDASDVDWSCFDFILTAGAPMPSKLKEGFRRLSGNRLGELWGLTEGFTTIIQPHEMGDHLDSVGRAAPGTDLRLIDDEDREVGQGVEGELVGRSLWMMTGYHNRPEATAGTIWLSPEGIEYIRSGDIGVRDTDGWITIRGRKKDMLISGGLNVYPTDIENVVRLHEDVADCAVAGIPQERWGEVPVAFVVFRDGATTDNTSLMTWANERLGRHQRLHAVVPKVDLPRNTLGKVLKNELVATFLER